MDWQSIATIVATIVAVISAVAAIYSALYTKKSLEQQRDQWINQEFIRRESEILLKFRSALGESVESINWIKTTLFNEQKFVHFLLGKRTDEKNNC